MDLAQTEIYAGCPNTCIGDALRHGTNDDGADGKVTLRPSLRREMCSDRGRRRMPLPDGANQHRNLVYERDSGTSTFCCK